MKDFEYQTAATVDEAVSLLAARGERAKVLTGGTDLIVQLREGLREADLVVDVKKIPELMELAYDANSGLRLGAAVPCYRIYNDDEVASAYPALADSARIIGGWQIQSRASIGGNLCNSSPAADSIPTLIAYDVTCHLAGPQGRRTICVAQFCTAPGKNVLARGEIVTTLAFPPPAAHSGAAYLRFIPRNEMDIAVVLQQHIAIGRKKCTRKLDRTRQLAHQQERAGGLRFRFGNQYADQAVDRRDHLRCNQCERFRDRASRRNREIFALRSPTAGDQPLAAAATNQGRLGIV